MTTKQWASLWFVAILLAPLHWAFIQWLFDRSVFCRDKIEAISPATFECGYPQQRVTIEQGVTQKLGVCRCP